MSSRVRVCYSLVDEWAANPTTALLSMSATGVRRGCGLDAVWVRAAEHQSANPSKRVTMGKAKDNRWMMSGWLWSR